MRQRFMIVVIALFVAGCMSSGNKMDRSKVDEIQKGVTTRAQVEQKLGSPDSVSMMGDGRRMLMYHYSESQAKATNFIPYAGLFAGGSDMRRQTLQIIMNKDNVVQDYEFSDKTGEVKSGMLGATHTETDTPVGTK